MKNKTKTSRRPSTGQRVAHAAAPQSKRQVVHVNPANGKRAKTKVEEPLLRAPLKARYNTLARFDQGLHYVTDETPTPTGKAKVKLELASRTDANLVGFGHNHDEAIDGNPNFLTPQPTKIVFNAKLAELEAILTALENHRVAGRGLTDQRDLIRGEFEMLFTQRGTYVELASGGDPTIITSAGLPVRNTPTPMGELPFPGNLRVDLGDVAGAMKVRWISVSGGKAYMLEMAEVVNDVTGEFALVYTGGRPIFKRSGMTIGKTYAFRVCAIGGEGGRSAWSPEERRAAA